MLGLAASSKPVPPLLSGVSGVQLSNAWCTRALEAANCGLGVLPKIKARNGISAESLCHF